MTGIKLEDVVFGLKEKINFNKALMKGYGREGSPYLDGKVQAFKEVISHLAYLLQKEEVI